jgi:hypothetical protein
MNTRRIAVIMGGPNKSGHDDGGERGALAYPLAFQ